MDFSLIRKEYEKDDKEREGVISISREIVKASKKVIYALHRKDMGDAEKNLDDIKKKVSSMTETYSSTKQEHSGSYKVAMQEYVEAISYFHFVKTGKLLEHDKSISYEHYLLGICDLSGELVRKALNEGIEGNFEDVMKIKSFISELYDELSSFDFRNGDLRKKIDSMRWDMKKLDDMAFELKARGKI